MIEYNSEGNLSQKAISLSYLSLGYQQLGQWQEAERNLNEAIAILESQSQFSPQIQAQIFNTQGSLNLALGKPEKALENWENASKAYLQVGDNIGWLGSQINQTQALQKLGFYSRSRLLLGEIKEKIAQENDNELKVIALENLGLALSQTGDFLTAETTLNESLNLSQELFPQYQANILINLGNAQQALNKNQEALLSYQESFKLSTTPQLKLDNLLNQFSLLIKTENYTTAQSLFPEIEEYLKQLSPSREQVYAQVNFAENLIKYQKLYPQDSQVNLKIGRLLGESINNAQTIGDISAQSYGLGTLGKLYLENKQWQEAKIVTSNALQLAQSINAEDITYQWQWQLGKIENALGNQQAAIASYREAVNNLNNLRGDLVGITNDAQFSFKEKVEPVYRELVTLLLTEDKNGNISQENLEKARQTLESLQLVELENFFREACLDVESKPIDQIDTHASVIYTIILEDRLAVILSQANQPLNYYATYLPKTEIEKTINEFLQSLNPAFSNKLRQENAQKIYDWIITPAESIINPQQIDTFVFVLDGVLQNIPMAALYDGEKYLIEKYSIALTPGLQLLSSKTLETQEISAFMAGVSEANLNFVALPGVETEMEEIASTIPSEQILNNKFTRKELIDNVDKNNFPILHFATHGQFSSNPDETFILAWQDSINIKEFQNILRSRELTNSAPLELLVLSACQTASGDKRAALGLAGMAVRSGARSTLATLWSVKDESTVMLMTEFYKALSQPEIKFHKGKALRTAQLELLKTKEFAHPFYWAPFILVGNWL